MLSWVWCHSEKLGMEMLFSGAKILIWITQNLQFVCFRYRWEFSSACTALGVVWALDIVRL